MIERYAKPALMAVALTQGDTGVEDIVKVIKIDA